MGGGMVIGQDTVVYLVLIRELGLALFISF